MKCRTSGVAATFLIVLAVAASGQDRALLGVVTDSRTGEPLSVGQVNVRGTELSDRLRPDGVFVLHVPAEELTLVVSCLGYKTEEVRVAPNQAMVRVELEVDALKLERLVVSGHATEVERRHLAIAAASLDSRSLNAVPATTWEEMLHGKIAGLQVKQSSAAPGGGNNLSMRGITSIFGSSAPLFVLDGVIVSDARIDGGMNAISLADGRRRIGAVRKDGLPNRIADLNPNDIASIEVLRGAAAAVLYGSRGANGVVIIKTKRGGEW